MAWIFTIPAAGVVAAVAGHRILAADQLDAVHAARPRAAGGEDDFANPNRVTREGHGRQRCALRLKQCEIGPGIAPDHARRDLAISRARANLIVAIEQVIGHDERLRVDRNTARRTAAAPAKQQQARPVSNRGGSQFV
jgi:hypothetical protein